MNSTGMQLAANVAREHVCLRPQRLTQNSGHHHHPLRHWWQMCAVGVEVDQARGHEMGLGRCGAESLFVGVISAVVHVMQPSKLIRNCQWVCSHPSYLCSPSSSIAAASVGLSCWTAVEVNGLSWRRTRCAPDRIILQTLANCCRLYVIKMKMKRKSF